MNAMKRVMIVIIGLLLLGCTPATTISLRPHAEVVSVAAAETSSKPSADGTTLVKSIIQEDVTQVTVNRNGPKQMAFEYDGRWAVTAVAPNGGRFVLSHAPSAELTASWQLANQWRSDIRVYSAADGVAQHIMQLDGNFEVEAIDNKGSAVYLIEHIPAFNPEKYRIRLYDLTIDELAPDPLRDKRVTEEFMTGYAWGTAASSDGEWLMTLYMNEPRSQAFIHALNVANRYTFCLDLPSGNGEFAKMQHYTLALTPDNSVVYAANAALGRLVGIDLSSLERTHSVTFDAIDLDTAVAMHASAISNDGQRLYFSADQHLWTYNAASRELSAPLLLAAAIERLQATADGVQVTLANGQTQAMTAVSFPKAAQAQK